MKPELFSLLLSHKHQEGAGLAHVELSPPQTKAWFLSIPWLSAVLGERRMLNSWNDAQLPPCSDLAAAIGSCRQIQADRETHLIGAQCLYWHHLLLLYFFFSLLLRNSFISKQQKKLFGCLTSPERRWICSRHYLGGLSQPLIGWKRDGCTLPKPGELIGDLKI